MLYIIGRIGSNHSNIISGHLLVVQNDLQLYQYCDQYLAGNGVQIHLLPIKDTNITK